ncbi:MAG: anaerobic ribonucleoside-triphosphate reductase activating protein [Candidatus Omnitrophica bacterium]|nr:anaerobic ribonucleoside-triphosphate reductase activating protein [Candidatus Omnitrophota bacterium]
MRIAGLQKLSLVDYPGLVSAVIFTAGCDFSCSYCQNPDLVNAETSPAISTEEVLGYLSGRSGFVDGVVITGGEPAMQKDLPQFISILKSMGFKVKLDTNGNDPGVLRELMMERLLDYAALDIKTSFGKYSLVSPNPGTPANIEESVYTLMLSTIDHEFRTTCVPGIVDEKDIGEISRYVRGAKKYFLQQFRPEITLDRSIRDLNLYSKEDLLRFKEILSKHVRSVDVRGV